MDKTTTSIFTFFKKYSIVLGILSLLFLTACSSTEPIDENSTGFFNHYFVFPFSLLIKGIAGIFGDSYGLAIIIITLIIRLVLMPFFLNQTKSSMQMRDKMNDMKPELDAIQEKYKNKKDRESQLQMQQEMIKLYQKHNINPFSTMAGCLPILIQFPILIGFYYAILRTPEIATHSFLWFDLGSRDLILTAFAVIVYFVQFKVSQIGMDPKLKQQMAIMGLISPIMIGVISINAPAALPLYWSVSGTFMILQTFITRKIYMANTK